MNKQNPYTKLWLGLKVNLEEYEISKYWKENPEEDIRNYIKSFLYEEENAEILEFADAEWEENIFNQIFKKNSDWKLLIKSYKNNEFSKKIVIDKKTSKIWILLISKKWIEIKDSIFENIINIDTPYETYFAYRQNWKTYIRFVKNNEYRDNWFSFKLDIISIHLKEKLEELGIKLDDFKNPNFKLDNKQTIEISKFILEKIYNIENISLDDLNITPEKIQAIEEERKKELMLLEQQINNEFKKQSELVKDWFFNWLYKSIEECSYKTNISIKKLTELLEIK